MKRIRLAVLYGGRSAEHQVSVVSARSVMEALDPDRFEVVPIAITRDGAWLLPDRSPLELTASGGTLPEVEAAGRELAVRPEEGVGGVDVVFPILHGPLGEDGTVQGLLELADLPYVGSGVLASAVGMDKAVMKVVFAAAGLPVSPGRVVLRHEWDRERDAITAACAGSFGYPLFVKPANLGSSVGISKAADLVTLVRAIDLAFEFDRKVLIEQAVPEAREIECAVLGNEDPEASVPGEIVPNREFYDYEAKYLDDQSAIIIPAALSDEL